MILNVLSILFIVTGLFSFLGASVGVLRFPDFYTRMHAAGKGDSLSSLLILGGFALQQLHDLSLGGLLVAIKILMIGAFIVLTSPTSTHALMEAGYDDGIKPWAKGRKEKDKG